MESWRVQKKWKEERWEKKKKKDNKKKVKQFVEKKAKERIACFLSAKWKEEEEEEKGRKSKKTPQDKTSLGQVWNIVVRQLGWPE